MTKSKSSGLSNIPKEQKCSFLIGPVSSWFTPNTIDLWTQPKLNNSETDSNTNGNKETAYETTCDQTSYFAYGSLGCFCLGEIHHRPNLSTTSNNPSTSHQTYPTRVAAVVNKLADVKNDNSKVVCVRFQRKLTYPILSVLTGSGSLLIYDCLTSDNLALIKKSEVLKRFVGLTDDDNQNGANRQQGPKRAKFNITQQLNSFTWPNPSNLFIGVTLINEKTCLLIRLKLDVTSFRDKIYNNCQDKREIIVGHQKIDLELNNFSSPICLVESAMLDEKSCLVATALDNGLIVVKRINLDDGRVMRTIQLARHTNEICSMSLDVSDQRKFPLGLLASISRDGLALVWDLENEFYFADYLAIQVADRASSAKINWFALKFINIKDTKSVYLAVSNAESGLSLLKVPDNARSKIRLKELQRETKPKARNSHNDSTNAPKHNALIFNIEFDPVTQTLISSSLDGNQILWSTTHSDKNPPIDEIKQRFLIPALLDTARTHMLRHNPINESLLGLALGKAGVRFYSIKKNLLDSRYDMSPSCALVARKISKASSTPTSIAWHPHHEYRLAIGTLEGKVFRADITPHKAALIEMEPSIPAKLKPTTGSNLDFSLDEALGVDYQPMKRAANEVMDDCPMNGRSGDVDRPKTDGVYSLCWGPNPACPEDINKHAIYAVGSRSHRLFVYCNAKENSDTMINYLDEFQDTSLPEAGGSASEVAWKSSMDLMALGTTDGRILVVAYLDESHQERSNHRLFKHLLTIEGPFGKSSIQCLAWHPAADKEHNCYYKIAASSNDSPAFVFNLKETILVADVKARLRIEMAESGSSAPTSVNLLASYTNELKKHEKAITDIAWNPHEPNELATCSFDRTCYVWSIDSSLLDARITAKFIARDRLFTLDWSLVDSDLIFTSGHDSVVWAWRPSENRNNLVSF